MKTVEATSINGFASSGAVFSDCETFRFRLWRQWGPDAAHYALFVLLNPSTATATEEDPTIRRCIGYAKAWQFDRVEIVNLFAYRATDPNDLIAAAERGVRVIGNGNDGAIVSAARAARCIVAGWGVRGRFMCRDFAVLSLLTEDRDVLALRTTKQGRPEHPLYLPGDLRPTVFRECRRAEGLVST